MATLVLVGRKAGVAAEETKASLLSAAAKVFARRGYDAASISEITSEAGLTSGAIYAHYASKAELFVATLRVHMQKDLDLLLGNRRLQRRDEMRDLDFVERRRGAVRTGPFGENGIVGGRG